jgi:hypothetical protein
MVQNEYNVSHGDVISRMFKVYLILCCDDDSVAHVFIYATDLA